MSPPNEHPNSSSGQPIDAYLFEDFRVDVAARQLFKDGKCVALSARTFDTLLLLAARNGDIVSKEELIQSLWPHSFVSEDSLTHHISILRRALGDDPTHPRCIATVARRGYRFIPTVATVPGAVVDTSVGETATNAAPRMKTEAPATPVEPPAVGRYPSRMWTTVTLALGVVALLLGIRTLLNESSDTTAPRARRVTQGIPPGTTLTSAAVVSPDGNYLAFAVQDDLSGRTQLWVRSFDAAEPRSLPGTDGASRPFWSTDSQSVGFFSNDKLKIAGLIGDAPRTLAQAVRSFGASWSPDGRILFATDGSINVVPSAGGEITTVLAPDRLHQLTYRWPQFLPDGRRFVYYVATSDEDRAGTYVGTLGSDDRTRILDGSIRTAVYAPPGVLLYISERVLRAQPFDPERLQLTGEPSAIATNVSSTAVVSASSDGLLVFGSDAPAERLTWFDRSGKILGTLAVPTTLRNLMFSPDQKYLLGGSVEPEQDGVWLVDVDRGAPTRVVSKGNTPVWSPDGNHIAFTSGLAGVYIMSTFGRGDGEEVLLTADPKVLSDWSRDDRYLVYAARSGGGQSDLWLLPRFGDRRPLPFLETPFNETQPQVSPDGRWIAYMSDESGTTEIYVQSFPTAGAKRAISNGGGTEAQWRGDGRELFYLSPDHTLMTVEVELGQTVRVGRSQPLFHAPVLGPLGTFRNHYAATADGQRFLISAVNTKEQQSMNVIVNWTQLVRR